MFTKAILCREKIKFEASSGTIPGYTYDGIVTRLTVGETIDANTICYYNDDGKMYKTHSVLFDKFPMMALQPANINEQCLFFVRGYIKNPLWTWDVNSATGNIFVNEFYNRGELTQKFDKFKETEHHVYNTLGKILSPTELMYSPDIYLLSTLNYSDRYNINTPIINDPGLLCPFHFHLISSECSGYYSRQNLADEINPDQFATCSAIWQIAEEPTFNETLPGFHEIIISYELDMTLDISEIIVDSGLIKPMTSYYARMKYRM